MASVAAAASPITKTIVSCVHAHVARDQVHTPTFKGERLELQLLHCSMADATARGYELLARLRGRQA